MYRFIVYGLLCLVGSILLARLIHAAALKRVASERGNVLLRSTARLRRYSLMPAVAVVVPFVVAFFRFPEAGRQIVWWFAVIIGAYSVLLNIIYFIKVGRARVKFLFVVSALISRAIALAGIVMFCLLLYRAVVI